MSRIHELFSQAKTKETLTIAHTELMSWLDSGDRDEVAGLGLWSRKEYERIMVLVAQEESLGRWETNEEDESSESPQNLRAFWAGNEHRCEPFCDALTEGALFTVTNLDSALKQARAIEKELLNLK